MPAPSLRAPAPPSTSASDFGAKSAAGRRRSRTRWRLRLVALVVAAAVLGSLAYFSEFEWTRISAWMENLHTGLALLLMAVLPVAGFSIIVVYLVAGAKFGPLLGGLVVLGVTAFHLLATHFLARGFLRERLQDVLERRGHRLPSMPAEEGWSIALMVTLVPGLPYCARNVLLALSDIPLRVYFLIALPIYVARSYVTVAVGDLSSGITPRGLMLVGCVFVVKLSVCGYVLWRLRRRHQGLKTGRAL